MGILERGRSGNLAPTPTGPALAPASAGRGCVTVLLRSAEAGCVKDQPWRSPTVPGTQNNFRFYCLCFKSFLLHQNRSCSVPETAYSNGHSVRKYLTGFAGESMSQTAESDFKCCVPNNIVFG